MTTAAPIRFYFDYISNSASLAWMFRNTMRRAALLGIPLNAPEHHPFNPQPALRVSARRASAEDRTRAISAPFRAVGVDREHVSEPEVVARVVDGAGLPGARRRQAMRPEALRARARKP